MERAKEVIRIEADAIRALEDRIDENFMKAVDILLQCKGRVIVTGMGKSGIIAQKIAATLTSTGTASLFLHPAEGVHGDLGIVLKEDVIVCISKSGNTEEILKLIPNFMRKGVPIISLLGNTNSLLAQYSDVVLDVSVAEEACSYDLVPTASTTATLVMGDALALSIFQKRGLSVEDFVQLHPGGDIGKRFFMRVDAIMRKGADIPCVNPDTPLVKTILEITSKRLGAACIVDPTGKLIGIITDGDLRRLMEKRQDIVNLKAMDVMNPNPKTIHSNYLAQRALDVMEEFSINQLIVINNESIPVGMVHIHDLIKAGLSS